VKNSSLKFAIRESSLEDIPGIIEFLKECRLYWEMDDTPEKLSHKLSADRDLMLLAVSGETIVGFAMASFDGWAALIWHFGVLPQYRSSQIALSLLRAISGALKKRGANIAYGLVMGDNAFMLKHAGRLFVDGPTVKVVWRTL
jgi:ribosomal protein S18 acetylase RimI-like enzyme